MSTVLHVVLLAVVAGASPLALTATLAVVEGDRPRADGIGFAAGYVVGTAVGPAAAFSMAALIGFGGPKDGGHAGDEGSEDAPLLPRGEFSADGSGFSADVDREGGRSSGSCR